MNGSFSLFKNIIRLINCIFRAVFRSFQFFNNQNRIAFLFLLLFFWGWIVLSRLVLWNLSFFFRNLSYIFSNIFSFLRSFTVPPACTSVKTHFTIHKSLSHWKNGFFMIIFIDFIGLVWFSMKVNRKLVLKSIDLVTTWRSVSYICIFVFISKIVCCFCWWENFVKCWI